MKILKRNGREVNFNPNKILQRIKNQSKGLKVNADELSISIISQMMDGITSRELDNLCIEGSAMKVVSHPDYSTLAARLFVTGMRKDTPASFASSLRNRYSSKPRKRRDLSRLRPHNLLTGRSPQPGCAM